MLAGDSCCMVSRKRGPAPSVGTGPEGAVERRKRCRGRGATRKVEGSRASVGDRA